MYSILDITNILSNTESCPKNLGDKICNGLKKGKIKFDTTKITNYQTLEYLLLSPNLDEKKCLIDKLQDICSSCEFPTTATITSGGGDCPSNAIITEVSDCIITESGDYIIVE